MNVPHVPDEARVSVDNLGGQWDGIRLVGLHSGLADDQDIPAGPPRPTPPPSGSRPSSLPPPPPPPPSRDNRTGYRHRGLGTPTGTIDVAIPTLREGTYMPDWLLTRHRRAGAALTTVVATCYLLGIRARRMDEHLEAAREDSLHRLPQGAVEAALGQQPQRTPQP